MIYAEQGRDVPKILKLLRDDYVKENSVWEPIMPPTQVDHEYQTNEMSNFIDTTTLQNPLSEDSPMSEP